MKKLILAVLAVGFVVAVAGLLYIQNRNSKIKAASSQATQANQASATSPGTATNQAKSSLQQTPSTTDAPAVPTADQLVEFKAKNGSKVRIEGTSTIHDWYAEGGMISGVLKIDKSVFENPKVGPVYATAKSLIPITSLKSSSGSAMDTIMLGPKGFDTEQGPAYQQIRYNLDSLIIKKLPSQPGQAIECDSRGDLMIHATTNKIDLPVTILRNAEDNSLEIKGRTKLKMSTYNIAPPKLTIVAEIITGDDVEIIIDWKLAQVKK